MRAYLIRRLLLIIPTLWILTILVFLSVRFIPGDTIDLIASRMRDFGIEVDREFIERMLGLDVPVHVQYGRWIGVLPTPDWVTGESHFKGLLQGTLGESLMGSRTVEEKIIGRLPVTIELGVLAIIIGLVIVALFNFYISVVEEESFRRRFSEMAGILVVVSLISFVIGLGLKGWLGV